MSLLDESNMSQHSPDSASSESLLPDPCVEVVSSGAPAINAASVTEQVFKILFINAEDSPSKWEFLKTKAPFPVSKLVENKAIAELLLAIEPGPKVDYDGLSRNLALLKPYVLNTPSGPALLGFFKSLLQLRVRWLLAAAKLEAFRCYERTTFTYYVEWNDVFRMDTTGRDLDERELAYQNECQEYTQNQLSASFIRQEAQLAKVVKVEEAKLINCKTSQEMWKNSRILWTITEKYQHYQQMKKLAIQQKQTQGEEMKKNTSEILHRQAQVKKNEDVGMRQNGGAAAECKYPTHAAGLDDELSAQIVM